MILRKYIIIYEPDASGDYYNIYKYSFFFGWTLFEIHEDKQNAIENICNLIHN